MAETELDEWPSIARDWLDRGYASQALTDFAALTPSEGVVLADLMIDVLRSLGVAVPIDRDLAEHVFTISGFEQRCSAAISKAGADLQRTWRDVEVGILANDNWGTPPVSVQVLVGDYGSHGGEALYSGMSDEDLLATAAKQISDTLHEHIGVRWPLCIQHGKKIMSPYAPVTSVGQNAAASQASWWCDSHPHPVAPIGGLSTSAATFETLWWSAERELPQERN